MNHSQFPKNDAYSREEQQNDSAQPNARYEYVFSYTNPQYTKKNSPKKGLKFFLIISICCIFSFASAFGGVLAARELGLLKSPSDDSQSVYHDNPNQILEKNESDFSIYGSAGDEVLTISQVVKKVEDSIVVINSTIYKTTIFGTTQPSTSAGSGVIIDESGYILTCYHVVEGASKIQVTLNSSDTYDATLVGSDSATDIAVLKITPNEALTAVQQGCSADLVVGEYVIAIGNPLGTLSGTVTSGIISATERNIQMSDGTVMTLLQTDAAINSGNSGGGLFNLQGELIGIVNSKYASSGVEGLAFAIPIDSAYEVQVDLIEFGYVRGVIDTGLTVLEITNEMLQRNSIYYQRHGIYEAGLYVIESKYCTDLYNADRIVAINGSSVNSDREFKQKIKEYRVGDTINVTASRGGELFSVEITLREYVPVR